MPAHGPPRPPVPATAGLRLAGGLLAWLGGSALQLQQPMLWPATAYVALLAGALIVAIVGFGPAARGSAGGLRGGGRLLILGSALAAAAFAGTGLRAGDRLPGLLGYEVDCVHDRAASTVQVLAESPWITR
ncbi:MAG: hypothetical protein J0L57_02875, partial [Burkholderiales bacterium]|nr:hypothetical protein [Burkholderiales bacterium]